MDRFIWEMNIALSKADFSAEWSDTAANIYNHHFFKLAPMAHEAPVSSFKGIVLVNV